mgnify:CR=1 FL=1
MLGCFVVATSFVWTFHWSSLVETACPVHKMICRAQHFIFCVLILVWFWFLIFCEFWKNCSDFFWFLNFDFCFSLELDSWSLIFYWFCALKFSKIFILILVPKKSSMVWIFVYRSCKYFIELKNECKLKSGVFQKKYRSISTNPKIGVLGGGAISHPQ